MRSDDSAACAEIVKLVANLPTGVNPGKDQGQGKKTKARKTKKTKKDQGQARGQASLGGNRWDVDVKKADWQARQVGDRRHRESSRKNC